MVRVGVWLAEEEGFHVNTPSFVDD